MKTIVPVVPALAKIKDAYGLLKGAVQEVEQPEKMNIQCLQEANLSIGAQKHGTKVIMVQNNLINIQMINKVSNAVELLSSAMGDLVTEDSKSLFARLVCCLADEGVKLRDALEMLNNAYTLEMVRRSAGNKAEAARRLGADKVSVRRRVKRIEQQDTPLLPEYIG